MLKILCIGILMLGLTGCSALKIITAPFKSTVSTVPQQINQAKTKDVCRGEVKFNEQGYIIYCSKGYYSYSEDYQSKERKVTLKEKILQFFDKLVGWGFWLAIGLVIFCPSLLGFIVGRIVEGIFGITSKAFRQVVSAVQKAKNTSPTLIQSLEASTDENIKKFITEFKQKNNIK